MKGSWKHKWNVAKTTAMTAALSAGCTIAAYADADTGAIKTYIESTIGTVFNLISIGFACIGGFSLITGIYALVHSMGTPGGGQDNGGTKLGVGICTLALAALVFGFKDGLITMLTANM